MWPRFLLTFGLVLAGALFAAAAAIALIDPLAISPVRIVSDEILPQTNRRYLVPAIVRGRRYDSYLIGTSTIHLFDPRRFDEFGIGRFANLSLFASTPYEQLQVVRLIVRKQPDAKNIIWGIDLSWCSALPPSRHSELSEFPDWLYDDDPMGHLAHGFNWSAIDLARRKVEQVLRPKDRRLRSDGFLRIMPADSAYDLRRSQRTIWGEAAPPKLMPIAAPTVDGSADAGERVPSISILHEAADALPRSARAVFVLLPFHATLLPEPKSSDEKTLEDCKAAIAKLAQGSGGWVIDAMWRSAWTVDDSNFWDAYHFRDRVAEMLIASIGAALKGERVEPESTIRVLAKGRP
jgi:hypothetical protein